MLFNPMILPGTTTTTTTTVRSYGCGRTPFMPHTSVFGGYPMMGSYPVMGGYGIPMMGGYYGCGYNSSLDTMLQVGAGIALGSAVAKTGIVETLFSGIGKAASWTWNKAIKPGATWLWNKALKPAGQWIGKTATNIYNGTKKRIADAKEAAAAKKAAKAAGAEA